MSRGDTTSELTESQLDDLSQITDEILRTQFLARADLCSAAIARKVTEASRTKLRINPRQSLGLAEAAIAIALSLNDEEALGPGLRAKGNALYVLGDNQTALNCHEQALAIFRRLGNREEQARTLNASIQPHILLGNYDRALEAAQAAREIFQLLGDQRRLAYVEINVGNLYHRQDRFEEGLASYERAYEIFLLFADSEGLGIALYNMSVCLISLNDFPRALASYHRARETFLRHGMSLMVGQADYNIAYLYYLRGEYGRAIEMLRATRAQCEMNGDAHILALCYLDLSDIYLELNLSAQASESAHEGVQRFRKLGMGYEEAKCLANEAIASIQQGKPLHALALFAEARSIFVQEKNQVWPSLIDLYSALAYFDERRFFEAQKFCQMALKFFETSNSSGKAVLCYLLLARIELQNGNSARALERAGDAYDALARLTRFEMPILQYQVHYFMGQAHYEAGNEVEAYFAYQKARGRLEALRSQFRKEELKIPFVKNKSAAYERLIQICLDRDGDASSLPEAFQYIELMKHRSLFETILNEVNDSPKIVTGNSDMVRRIRDLREELNWYDHRIEISQLSSDPNDPARVEQLQMEAFAREKALIQILQELPESAPEAKLFRPAEIAPLERIQASLPPGVSLIEYFAVGDQLLAALVTTRHLKILPVTLLSRLSSLVPKFRAHLLGVRPKTDDMRRTEGEQLQATQGHLQTLHAELLEPLMKHVFGEHIVFVPHGLLHCVPFHALFDGNEYLIDQFSVSYAPSASFCALHRDRTVRSTHSSILLDLGTEETAVSQQDLSAIVSALNSPRVLFGAAETPETLRDICSTAGWIHIANRRDRGNHGLSSGIRTAKSYLSLGNLYQLQLQPEVMSLSGFAPDLGMDDQAAGDDLAGLLSCLLESGARSLVSALWEVHLPSRMEFLKMFYAQSILREAPTPKAKIFRNTLLSLRQLYPHPIYWAPFFLADALPLR